MKSFEVTTTVDQIERQKLNNVKYSKQPPVSELQQKSNNKCCNVTITYYTVTFISACCHIYVFALMDRRYKTVINLRS